MPNPDAEERHKAATSLDPPLAGRPPRADAARTLPLIPTALSSDAQGGVCPYRERQRAGPFFAIGTKPVQAMAGGAAALGE